MGLRPLSHKIEMFCDGMLECNERRNNIKHANYCDHRN